MARYIWTLFAGFVLGLFAVFSVVIRIRTIRKPTIDLLAKTLVDWIYGVSPDAVREKHSDKYGSYSLKNHLEYNYQNMRIMVGSHQNTIDILIAMKDIIAERGYFTVADLKTGIGLDTTFADMQYGWRDAEKALFFSKAADDNSGWILETRSFPEAIR